MERRVVITGLGAVTPIGNDVDTFWENLKACKCVPYIVACLLSHMYRKYKVPRSEKHSEKHTRNV